MKMYSLTPQQTLQKLVNLNQEYLIRQIMKYGAGESILIDLNSSIHGALEIDKEIVRKNLLLANFGCLLFGLLANDNYGPAVSVTGASYTLRTSADVNYDMFYVAVGRGTSPPAMTDYDLVSRTHLSTSRTIGYFDTETHIIGIASPTIDFSEAGVVQTLAETGGAGYIFLLARLLVSGRSGNTITYRVKITYPWTQNLGTLMGGIMMNTDIALIDISNVSFTARTTGDVNAGAIYLVGSPTSIEWRHNLTNIPEAFTLSTARLFINPRTYILFLMIGSITPSETITLSTLGLYQPIFDTSGTTRTVCFGVIPLASPVELTAGRVNIVMVRFLLA